MKLTNRMKKILLSLLHPEKTFKWFRKNNIHVVENDSYFEDYNTMMFLENRTNFSFSHSEIVSYRRTFDILENLGFVEFGGYCYSFNGHWARSYKLTDVGRKTAKKIEKEIRDFIKEYNALICLN